MSEIDGISHCPSGNPNNINEAKIQTYKHTHILRIVQIVIKKISLNDKKKILLREYS